MLSECEQEWIDRRPVMSRRPLADVLYETFREQAELEHIECVTIGLGYTAVQTTAGDVGLSYTMAGHALCCRRLREDRDLDGVPALEVLACVRSADTLERSLGIALVNALNQRRALTMSEDAGMLMAVAGIGLGVRVAMVGFFPPVVARLRKAGAEVSVLDSDLDMGDEVRFLRDLATWPDVLVVTATTILNATFEVFMDHVGPDVSVIVLGPTTPMIPEAFEEFPVVMLGGSVALDNQGMVSAVRQAALTPAVARHCRKIYWARSGA